MPSLHGHLGMEVTYHRALSGLGHHGAVFSSAANNRIQHPSRHQEAKRPVRLTSRYGPDTTSCSPWDRYHGS